MTKEDVIDDLLASLPGYFITAPDSGNYRLFEPIAAELQDQNEDITDVSNAAIVQEAETFAQLEELGKLIDTPPYENEALEHYRARLIAAFSIVTCEGTIPDVINTAAEIFDAGPTSFTYSEPFGTEYGTVEIGLPAQALDDSQLTDTETVEILNRLTAASYRVEGFRLGTFTYITPTDYNSNNHDATLGYDGLDANGDPKDNGGTYAGVLN